MRESASLLDSASVREELSALGVELAHGDALLAATRQVELMLAREWLAL